MGKFIQFKSKNDLLVEKIVAAMEESRKWREECFDAFARQHNIAVLTRRMEEERARKKKVNNESSSFRESVD